MNSRSGRNLQLDVLRGVAILLVFGRHLELPRPDGVGGAFADAWFRLGWLGVDLFFVLSGFLIGGLLVSELQRRGRIDIPRFLVRRGLKIYPAYFVFIAYLVLVPVAKMLAMGGDWWGTAYEQWSLYWPNLLFLQNYVGTNPAGHTWSLAVEEHFYILLPFALAALAAAKRTRALIPLCLLAVPILLLTVRFASIGLNDPYSEKMAATHLRLDALLFGVGIRCVAQFLPEQFQALRDWRVSACPCGRAPLVRESVLGTADGSDPHVGFGWHISGLGRIPGRCVPYARRRFRRREAIRERRSTIRGLDRSLFLRNLLVARDGVRDSRPDHRRTDPRLERRRNFPRTWVATTLVLVAGAIVAGVVATRVVEWPVLHLRDRFFPSRSGSLPAVGAPETAPITMSSTAVSQSVSPRTS